MGDKDFLKLAVEQAKKSMDEGGFPAGAIVVKDGKVIAEGVVSVINFMILQNMRKLQLLKKLVNLSVLQI